jgi:hypothetical protein
VVAVAAAAAGAATPEVHCQYDKKGISATTWEQSAENRADEAEEEGKMKNEKTALRG